MQDQQKEAREDLLKKTDEELRTLMMQALASEEIDIEYINCITDILVARHPEEYTFNGDGILDAALQVGEQNSARDTSESRPSASKRKPHTLRNMLAIAAVIAVVMTAGFVIPVHGTNLIGIIAHWTNELFSFGVSELENVQSEALTMEGSANSSELVVLLSQNGISTPLIPKYIPVEFELQRITSENENPAHQKFYAEFSNKSGERISISIRGYEEMNSVIEKDNMNVDIYNYAGIDHYIFTDIDTVIVSWTNGGFNCTLAYPSHLFTDDVLHKIIQSIYDNEY